MRLKFNVLCFEDNPTNIRRTLRIVRGHLEKSGFELHELGTYPNSDELKNIIDDVNAKRLDVDLILMDYKLANGDTGDYLIKNIRDLDLLTDIIFYSQDPNFTNELKKNGPLEGIYFAGRDTLPDKAVRVIDNLLKKALDLSGFRGLFMAETSELDDMMHHIILEFLDGEFFKNPVDEKRAIKKKAMDSCSNQEKRLEKINVENPNGTRELLKELGAYHKAMAVASLKKSFIKKTRTGEASDGNSKNIAQKLSGSQFDVEQYQKEIVTVRNMLAHARETVNARGVKVLKSTRQNKDDFVLDEEKSLQARRDLKKYYELLGTAYKTVTGKEWD